MNGDSHKVGTFFFSGHEHTYFAVFSSAHVNKATSLNIEEIVLYPRAVRHPSMYMCSLSKKTRGGGCQDRGGTNERNRNGTSNLKEPFEKEEKTMEPSETREPGRWRRITKRQIPMQTRCWWMRVNHGRVRTNCQKTAGVKANEGTGMPKVSLSDGSAGETRFKSEGRRSGSGNEEKKPQQIT